MSQDIPSGIGAIDSRNINKSIENVLTIAKLAKFKTSDLAKFKKLTLPKSFIKANLERILLILRSKKTLYIHKRLLLKSQFFNILIHNVIFELKLIFWSVPLVAS